MTSKIRIPIISKVNNMSALKKLVGKTVTKKVKFMNEEVLISKLTVEQVLAVQAKAKELENATDNNGLDVLKAVISASVEDAGDLDDSDYQQFPMDELSKLSQEIMKFSGFGDQAGK